MTTLRSHADLRAQLAGRVPLVVLETRDDVRAQELVRAAAADLAPPGAPSGSAHVFTWTVTDGLTRVDVSSGPPQRFNTDPGDVLRTLRITDFPGIYVLVDLHPFLDDPVHVRLLKDICQGYAQVPRTIVLLSHQVALPPELEHLAARLEVTPPDRAERAAVVDRVVADWGARTGRPVHIDTRARDLLVENLGGLSLAETERLARGAVVDDGALLPADVPKVAAARYALLARGGVLTFEYDVPPPEELGGLRRLTRWLRLRRPAFDGSASDGSASGRLDPPRGVLLLGVQGCGKSMAAKVAASILGVPALRLDVAAVHNKYVGESERLLRESLATAEALAPCVLWVDEIEKAFADSEGETGPSRRLLGTFLTWLAEKRLPVFVVATANDITGLPPELVRKGRFDEVFFVDLPDLEVRAHILGVHARRREVALQDGELLQLARVSEGFSGAELEQAVVSAVYAAHDDGAPVEAGHVAAEITATRPLSVLMAERLLELRHWAQDRTVPAD